MSNSFGKGGASIRSALGIFVLGSAGQCKSNRKVASVRSTWITPLLLGFGLVALDYSASAAEGVVRRNFVYAQAERWQPPREVTELRQAPESKACPQNASDGIAAVPLPVAEDCLLLNVWAPKMASGDGSHFPVMIFFHGGGLVSGSGLNQVYDAARFAERGIVFVAFNYRLGPLGFLAREGNWPELSLGLQDQIAAVHWVEKHIAHFGGDPSNLTFIGHSMGAYSIRRLVNLRAHPAGLRRVVLLSQGSMLGGERIGTISMAEQRRWRRTPWPELFDRLRERRLAVIPEGADIAEAWRGISVLQTVLQDEEGSPENYARKICASRTLADVIGEATSSYLYVLRPFGTDHGSEVRALFGVAGEDRGFLEFLVHFARFGEPRSWLGVFSAPRYRSQNPRVTFWGPWWQSSGKAPAGCLSLVDRGPERGK